MNQTIKWLLAAGILLLVLPVAAQRKRIWTAEFGLNHTIDSGDIIGQTGYYFQVSRMKKRVV